MKGILKTIADASAALAVLPALLMYRAGGLIAGPGRAFPGWSQAFALLPGLIGVYLRRAFYRSALRACAPDCCLGFGTIFSHPTAEVGHRVYVGPFGCLGDVTLEDDVLLGSHVSVANGANQHGIARLDVPIREQPGTWPRVTIGADSWVGDRSVVLADVGRHCVIGAGSVVTRPIPDYAIAVGVPARIVRYRDGKGPAPRGRDGMERGESLDRAAGPIG